MSRLELWQLNAVHKVRLLLQGQCQGHDSICASSGCALASQASPREPHGARRRL